METMPKMTTKSYLAIAHTCTGETTWSIIFPDFPGVTSMAKKGADIARQAKDALATAVEDMEKDGEDLPPSLNHALTLSFARIASRDTSTLLIAVETSAAELHG